MKNVVAAASPVPRISPATSSLRRFLDVLTVGVATAGAAATIVFLLLLTGILVYGAFPAISKFGFGFLTQSDWDPRNEHFGALPMIFGTLVSSLMALVLAVPVSIGTAIFLVRLSPKWLYTPVSFLVELLAAIPSITYGFWAVAVLLPFMQNRLEPFLQSALGTIPWVKEFVHGAPMVGSGLLATAITLAIMILPIITAVTRDILRAAPRDLEEGAYALGATWWQATRVVLGYCRTGIIGAVILGFARAIGETMAVTMVIGNSNTISWKLFAPGQTMASLLANEFLEADKPIYTEALIYIALVLLIMTLILNATARLLMYNLTRSRKAPAQAHAVVQAMLPSGVSISRTDSGENATTVPERGAGSESPGHVIRAKFFSMAMKFFCGATAFLTIGTLFTIVSYVMYMGLTSLTWDFFTKLPGPSGTPIGMSNAIAGTLILIVMASIIGVPLGMLCGIYLSEFSRGNWFSSAVRLTVDVLAGTPSIVVGVLIYQLIVKRNPVTQFLGCSGYSAYAGSIALSFMMIPIVARTTEEMLKLVPASYREASLGVGGSSFQTLCFIVLPAASTGIITGVMLAVARIAGETAPLLFTALGNDGPVFSRDLHIFGTTIPFFEFGNLGRPFPALTLKVFQYATSADDEWKRQAWAGMLVLVSVILMLSAAMRFVARERKY